MEEKRKEELLVEATIEILGFNPLSKKEEIFSIMITPKQARYILDNYNKKNRKLVTAQKNEIRKSVFKYGWLFTGDTIAFDLTGNLTEFQHRLEIIAEGKQTVKVWIATGVKKDTFEKAAPAKNRTKFDAVWRFDKSATKEDVTTLEQLLKWRAGKGSQSVGAITLDMVNAYKQFQEWKNYIRIGMSITANFFNDKKITKFDSWYRSFNAWATLMVYTNKKNNAKEFLKLLKQHHTTTNKCTLFTDMDIYFRGKDVGYLTGTKKNEQVMYMLCYATDRFLIAPKGDVVFDLKYVDSNHGKMLTKSTIYRSFLVNPQGLKLVA